MSRMASNRWRNPIDAVDCWCRVSCCQPTTYTDEDAAEAMAELEDAWAVRERAHIMSNSAFCSDVEKKMLRRILGEEGS